MRLLVVEDEDKLRNDLVSLLQAQGYKVDSASDGEDAYGLGDTEPYDAVILDLGLPIRDGLSVLRAWRREGHKMPVLILTARDDWSEKVAGFDAGADDYVTKPFSQAELLARLRALIRRSTGNASAQLHCGELCLDTHNRCVYLASQPLRLTAQEYRILNYFMHHQGRIISRTELTEHIYDQDFDLDSNTIDVFIGRLRKKLGSGYIETERGLGYRMRDGRSL